MAKNLVIVESPAKAKTIEKFLGEDFQVTSSYGHIRDLKKHDFSIDFNNNYSPIYEIPSDKLELVESLKKAAKKAETIWLASDEDREGEAISWHLSEVLKLKPENTKRIVFHEITKSAILNAIQSPRNIDINLVNAQQARRVLDRIVGFELSPILWRKIKPSLSAGRVQSVAVRLIVEREREIEKFKSEELYRIGATFATSNAAGEPVFFNATLNQTFKTEEEASKFLEMLKDAKFSVRDVQQKPISRQPAPPFTTSTLQQEAARRLHFTVTQTMSIAQRLYEAGQITYMRTDSVNLSSLCLEASKEQILETMGQEYLQTRNYTTQSKGAQEAHEAIRPTYMNQATIEGSTAEKRLYELIWKRTIASQMSDVQIEKTTAEIAVDFGKHSNDTESYLFVTNGEIIKFDGFLKVYTESYDEDILAEDNESSNRLPALTEGEPLNLNEAVALQRFTQHPQRYSEGSLVKKMEELGIGRPSTYAPTISTIQQRGYVVKSDKGAEKRMLTKIQMTKGKLEKSQEEETINNERGKLVPTDIGLVVNDYLEQHFPEIMSYNFTATVEGEFDKIAEGSENWAECLDSFYKVFHPSVTTSLQERADLKTGERILGNEPKTGHTVSVKISRFGPVAQIGQPSETNKPRFAALLKGQSIGTITLEEALKLFELPKTLGEYESLSVVVGVGRFGPYIQYGNKYVSIPKGTDPHDVELDTAIKLIRDKQQEDQKKIIRTFEEDSSLFLMNGPYGPYIAKSGKNYKLPHGKAANTLSYEDCLSIIENAAKK